MWQIRHLAGELALLSVNATNRMMLAIQSLRRGSRYYKQKHCLNVHVNQFFIDYLWQNSRRHGQLRHSNLFEKISNIYMLRTVSLLQFCHSCEKPPSLFNEILWGYYMILTSYGSVVSDFFSTYRASCHGAASSSARGGALLPVGSSLSRSFVCETSSLVSTTS